jgi:hypothetical protein
LYVELPSAQEMLKVILPKIIPEDIDVSYMVFNGKQDMDNRLSMRLYGWQRYIVSYS